VQYQLVAARPRAVQPFDALGRHRVAVRVDACEYSVPAHPSDDLVQLRIILDDSYRLTDGQNLTLTIQCKFVAPLDTAKANVSAASTESALNSLHEMAETQPDCVCSLSEVLSSIPLGGRRFT
jgi:hypothetical protein